MCDLAMRCVRVRKRVVRYSFALLIRTDLWQSQLFNFTLIVSVWETGDGLRWRGTFGEIAYRCGANLTLTAPFCEHRHFARFARYVLLLHSMCVNVFVSAAVTIGFDIHKADPNGDVVDTHRVNQFMRTNSYWIAGAILVHSSMVASWFSFLN